MAVGSFFFSAAPPAQNSPELHFRFIIFSIQPSLLESLCSLDEQYLSVDMYHEHISILALKDNCPSTFLCSHTVKYYKRHKGIPLVVYADNTLFLPITIFLNLVEQTKAQAIQFPFCRSVIRWYDKIPQNSDLLLCSCLASLLVTGQHNSTLFCNAQQRRDEKSCN